MEPFTVWAVQNCFVFFRLDGDFFIKKGWYQYYQNYC